jgi:hypothetical protein
MPQLICTEPSAANKKGLEMAWQLDGSDSRAKGCRGTIEKSARYIKESTYLCLAKTIWTQWFGCYRNDFLKVFDSNLLANSFHLTHLMPTSFIAGLMHFILETDFLISAF